MPPVPVNERAGRGRLLGHCLNLCACPCNSKQCANKKGRLDGGPSRNIFVSSVIDHDRRADPNAFIKIGHVLIGQAYAA